jgi:glycolate oxidase iron-sulfur subunit
MGREDEALAAARANIDVLAGIDGLDAIVINASGCGTTMKDYGFMLRNDPAYAAAAARIAALSKDIVEYLAGLPLKPGRMPNQAGARASIATANSAMDRSSSDDRELDPHGLVVAYHSACSLQHGQRVTRQPKEILGKLGFAVRDIPDGHLCCGSAGTYNILQPDIARRLRDLKVGTIERLRPDVIAAGNIGCITQLATGTDIPVVHTVELIDWATGGRCPQALRERRPHAARRPVTATG